MMAIVSSGDDGCGLNNTAANCPERLLLLLAPLCSSPYPSLTPHPPIHTGDGELWSRAAGTGSTKTGACRPISWRCKTTQDGQQHAALPRTPQARPSTGPESCLFFPPSAAVGGRAGTGGHTPGREGAATRQTDPNAQAPIEEIEGAVHACMQRYCARLPPS
ncbi:hypothetical protein GGTG_04361 [Gaeumannomyces tritici R3-111a-1]|uniref:Uncharacterized protein n=1 Tax=Gaeumannomyces tritici (strain R3-111a-1) TaxID=644352 RepID=J3NSW2_GAET3|nr:hypothetical protein GGTG_04361 [Gaeumannomyces tritici R3-111a-1]EJT79275.1 hypothetical protein GGTG_04361 [Gaeumannomyces tritici R3-111a-1]